MYPLTTHCSMAGEAPVDVPMDGNATLVTDTSNKVMNSAQQHTLSATHLRGSGSSVSVIPRRRG